MFPGFLRDSLDIGRLAIQNYPKNLPESEQF
jgi:hypothetical protein